MTNLQKIKSELDSRRGKLSYINNEMGTIESDLIILKKDKSVSLKALAAIQIVAQQTQQNIQYHIENLITNCIKNIGKDYNFKCEFVVRRDKTECDFYLLNEDGEKLDPYAEVGGSIIQIIDFALRCSLLPLQKGKIRNMLFLDEPFGGIKKNLYDELIKIVTQISKRLNLQLIIISHDQELIAMGDNKISLESQNNQIMVNYL